MTYNRLTRIGELVREMAEAHDPHTVNVAHGMVMYELDALKADLESAADGCRRYAHPGCNLDMHKLATGIAAIKTGRRFIGIEKSSKYFWDAAHRLEDELHRHPLLEPKPQTQGSLI